MNETSPCLHHTDAVLDVRDGVLKVCHSIVEVFAVLLGDAEVEQTGGRWMGWCATEIRWCDE